MCCTSNPSVQLFCQLLPGLWVRWLLISVFSTLRGLLPVFTFFNTKPFSIFPSPVRARAPSELEDRMESQSEIERPFLRQIVRVTKLCSLVFLHSFKIFPSKFYCYWSAYWTVLMLDFVHYSYIAVSEGAWDTAKYESPSTQLLSHALDLLVGTVLSLAVSCYTILWLFSLKWKTVWKCESNIQTVAAQHSSTMRVKSEFNTWDVLHVV